jgi:hypothetical protein
MCLAPEDEDGNAVDDEDEYAIEAISLTWEKGEPTTASALVRNIDKKPDLKVSSVSQVARLDRLLSSRVSQRMPSHTDRKYNYPYEPKAVDPERKVKRAWHKDVIRRLRVVQGSGPPVPEGHQRPGQHDQSPHGLLGFGDAPTS